MNVVDRNVTVSDATRHRTTFNSSLASITFSPLISTFLDPIRNYIHSNILPIHSSTFNPRLSRPTSSAPGHHSDLSRSNAIRRKCIHSILQPIHSPQQMV